MSQGDDIHKEELIKLFTANKWDKLLELLTDRVRRLGDTSLESDLNLMKSRYNELKHSFNLGTLGRDEYERGRAKIGQGVMHLMQEAYVGDTGVLLVLEEARGKMLQKEPRGEKKYRPFYLAAVFIALVLFLGSFVKSLWSGQQNPFSNTFYIQGKHLGDCPIPPGSSLKVFLSSQPHEAIPNEHCQLVINEIAGQFRRKAIPVRISLEAEGYELVHPDSQYVLSGEPVYLDVKRDNSLGWVHGKVWDKEGKAEFEGARIEIKSGEKSWVTTSDSLGNFVFYVPTESHRKAYQLIAKMGEKIWKGEYRPPNKLGISITEPE